MRPYSSARREVHVRWSHGHARRRDQDAQRGGADRSLPGGTSAPAHGLRPRRPGRGQRIHGRHAQHRALARRAHVRPAARRLRLLELAQPRHPAGGGRPRPDPLGPRRTRRTTTGWSGWWPPSRTRSWPASRAARSPGTTPPGARWCGSAEQFGEARRVYAGGESPAESSSATRRPACAERLAGASHSRCPPRRTSSGPGAWSRPGTRSSTSPRAAVYHSHLESPRAQAQRLIDVNRIASPERPRTRRRTVREAAGLLYRDTRSIAGLDEPPRFARSRTSSSCSARSRTTSSTSRARARPPSGDGPGSSSGSRRAAAQRRAEALALAQGLDHALVRTARRAGGRRGGVAPEHPERGGLARRAGRARASSGRRGGSPCTRTPARGPRRGAAR